MRTVVRCVFCALALVAGHVAAQQKSADTNMQIRPEHAGEVGAAVEWIRGLACGSR